MNAVLPFALEAEMRPVVWRETHKGSAALRRLIDGEATNGRPHYSRQSPGDDQFCRPGFNFCLLTSDGLAGWIVWRPKPSVGRMDGLEAWGCTLFRNDGARLSSDLVREATALTHDAWGWPPPDGLISSVGVEETKRRRSKHSPPGRCFIEAGWSPIEKAGAGKVWLRAPRPRREPRLEAT
jgi:hypothetical protein